MGSIAAWLAALLPSLVARVLAALGMGVITVAGFTAAWGVLHNIILANFSGAPADAMALANLGGFGTGLGLIFGAITARVSFAAVMSAKKIAGV